MIGEDRAGWNTGAGVIAEESNEVSGHNILPCPAMARLKVLFDL